MKVPTLLLIGGLVIKIIANQLFVPILDVTGAAIAGNIGLAAITLGLLLYFKKVWPIQLATCPILRLDLGRDCLYDCSRITLDDCGGRFVIRQVTVPYRGNAYRPYVGCGRSGRFPVRHHEITYNGGEGMVSTAIRQTFGNHCNYDSIKEKVNKMHQLTIIGLGAGDLDQLSLGTYRKLKEADFIVARTDQHPAIEELRAEGIALTSFDEII